MTDDNKIRDIIDDNNPDIEESVDELFNRLALVFWSPKDGDHHCSFCHEPAFHCNEEIVGFDRTTTSPSKYSTQPLYACESCLYDFETGDFDLSDPADHSLSQVLGEIIRDWTNRKQPTIVFASEYFDEDEIMRNHCDICNGIIPNERDVKIAISICRLVAHEKCARIHGFDGDNIDSSKLVEHLSCADIISMITNSEYTPPISSTDQVSLNQVVRDLIHTYDFSELQAFAAKFSIQHWVPMIPCTIGFKGRCHFCPNSAVVQNTDVNAKSCETCYTFIQQADIVSPRSSQSFFIRDQLQIKLNEIFHIKMRAQVLYENYRVQYRRCILCKNIVEWYEEAAVTNLHFAHVGCLQHKGKNKWSSGYKRFRSKLSLNDVINLPTFDIDTMTQLIRQ